MPAIYSLLDEKMYFMVLYWPVTVFLWIANVGLWVELCSNGGFPF